MLSAWTTVQKEDLPYLGAGETVGLLRMMQPFQCFRETMAAAQLVGELGNGTVAIDGIREIHRCQRADVDAAVSAGLP